MSKTQVTSEEHLIIVGKLEHNAAATELAMCTALRVLLGCAPNVARAIFFTLDSFPGKRQLLRRIVREVGDAKEAELVEDIIAASEKSNNQRKEVAHALMLFDADNLASGFKVYSPKSHDKKLATKEWHQHLFDASFQALTEGMTALAKLCEKRQVPLTLDLG
jgi:hypothetical protein